MHRVLRVTTVLPMIVLAFAVIQVAADSRPVRLRDHSDWWSIHNENFRPTDVKVQSTQMAAGNFQIAGISLAREQFDQIESKLGRAQIVDRGDASSGRHQICYVSDENAGKVYLIFEAGEETLTFYLFRGGSDWNGIGYCAKSRQISTTLSTNSGLRLGISRSELEGILGKPDFIAGDRVVYSREFKQKTTNEEFEKLRHDYPEKLSERAAHEKFDFYSIEIYFEARFKSSQMTYLAVSRSVPAE